MLTTHDDLKHVSVVIGGQPPTGFEAGAQVLSSWLDAPKNPNETPSHTIFEAVGNGLETGQGRAQDQSLEDPGTNRPTTYADGDGASRSRNSRVG